MLKKDCCCGCKSAEFCTCKNKKSCIPNNLYEKIRNVFGYEVFEKLNNLRPYFDDLHSSTYIGKLDDVWVQIRIPSDSKINYDNETKLVEKFKDYFYYKDGYIIKKWFPGVDLFKVKIDSGIKKAIFNCVKNFQNLNVDKIEKFDWFKYPIQDAEYKALVKKYSKEPLVLSHNNLKRQNILVNKYGFIKLVDFEYVALNNKYVDPVSLYLFLGIPKEDIIDFFKLDPSVFDDFVFLMRVYNEAMYLNDYSKNNSKSLSPFDSKSLYSNKDFLELNRFIVQKNHNNFDNKLNISKIEKFYFVPLCVYEDEDRTIWKWINSKQLSSFNNHQIKVLAKAMRTLHDSNVEFPEYILSKKINWYLDHMEIKTLLEDLKGNKRINEIIKWIKQIKPDANCHNNLNFNNIFFNSSDNLYIIDWSVAYRNNRYLDIAFLFENTQMTPELESLFWKSYGMICPKDFYKYRIIVHFTAYLYNKLLNTDFNAAKVNTKRINEIFEKLNIKD